jgi:hypothetical protein
LYQNERFTIILKINKDGNKITIDFPAMNWNQSVVGSVRSVNALPEKYRINRNLPLVNILASSLTVSNQHGYNLQLRSDGSFVISRLNGAFVEDPIPF